MMQNSKSNLNKVVERASMTRSVLAQLPIENGDPEVLKAYRLVYEACKKAACSNAEEEKAWDEAFPAI